jgi:hypothetical protein
MNLLDNLGFYYKGNVITVTHYSPCDENIWWSGGIAPRLVLNIVAAEWFGHFLHIRDVSN